MKGVKYENQSKKNIGVGSVVIEKVRYIEEETMEGRITRIRKEVVGYM